jgi:hypothetical protein
MLKTRDLKPFLAIVFVACFLLSSGVSTVLAKDVSVFYQFVDQSTGANLYMLNVVVPQSLIDYYGQMSHKSASGADFAKFVTPFALAPIAACIREIYPDDEDFANGVLTLVHQIPYEVIIPASYPVEILVSNKGDCDLLSFVAASVLKAGGLDVVLLHYPAKEHLNIGINLPDVPKNARSGVYSVTHLGAKYYVAECTSSDWKNGWRVGESPADLKNVSATILSLDQPEQVSPGQVSASFKKLADSSLGLNVSPFLLLEDNSFTASGQISPAVSSQNVTLYFSANGDSWFVAGTAVTGVDGRFNLVWVPEENGFLELRASWVGNDVYAGSTSVKVGSLVLPFLFFVVAVVLVIAVLILLVVYFITKHRSKRAAPIVERSGANL